MEILGGWLWIRLLKINESALPLGLVHFCTRLVLDSIQNRLNALPQEMSNNKGIICKST